MIWQYYTTAIIVSILFSLGKLNIKRIEHPKGRPLKHEELIC